MYGLPKDADLTFMVNRELLQVCVGSNEAILHFDDDLSITIMTTVRHEVSGRPTAVYEDSPASAAALVRFLGCRLLEIKGDEAGNMRMTFSNGETLEIRDEDPHYECYLIEHHDRVIVV
jgi:hypothetical protein